jgi:hypothetical protein
MKFLDKYRLYKNIIGQTPSALSVSHKKYSAGFVFKEPYTFDYASYKTNCHEIHVWRKNYLTTTGIIKGVLLALYYFDLPLQYHAYIYDRTRSNFLLAEFDSLFARKLLKHAEKHNK